MKNKYAFLDFTSPTSISKISTPSPHQSTARVYDVSVSTVIKLNVMKYIKKN